MNSTVTDLGRVLRKLRIDVGENLGEMAEKLGITSSYLSAIEKGKRSVPEGLIDNIASIYQLNEEHRSVLMAAADKTIQTIKLNLEGSTDRKRDVALCFARSFDELDDTTAEKVLKLLHGRRDA